MNKVPVTFKNYRNTYIKNIVNEMTAEDIPVDVIVSAMESLEHAHGEKLSNFGTPQMDVLWQTTFKTRQPHTEFLAPPFIR